MIDLHTHSTASDGSDSPSALVQLAAAQGVLHLALTDHDTTQGLAEARAACAGTSVSLINGIELSVSWNSKTLHLVGLDIDDECAELKTMIDQSQLLRIERGKTIGRKLEQAGIENAYAETIALCGTDVIGRAHFARMLIERGHAKNFKKVFKRFMVRGKPGFVGADWVDIGEAIDIVHRAGGVAVVAHPARYGLSTRQLEALFADFAADGGDAAEVVSGRTSDTEILQIARLLAKHNLAASIGSDYHGPDKPWNCLGQIAALPADCTPVWQRANLWQF